MLSRLIRKLPRRFHWSLHNLLGHPAQEILKQAGLPAWGKKVHDGTDPTR